jgi:hypothetical protein
MNIYDFKVKCFTSAEEAPEDDTQLWYLCPWGITTTGNKKSIDISITVSNDL